jgi:hypothetical protein
MSSSHDSASTREPRGEHRHLDERELFEAAASREPQSAASRESRATASTLACAQCAARLGELRAGLARLRELADVEPDRRGAALVQRVLARTVGEGFAEPLSWRGDLRLVLSFARERLRASIWLRVAAALLAIHVGALPVLAWIVLRADRPSPHFFSKIEPLPRESNFAQPEEAPLPLESSNPGDLEPGLVEVQPAPGRPVERGDGDRWSGERREQARGLRAFAWPAATAENRPATAFGARLWARSRYAIHGEAPAGFEAHAEESIGANTGVNTLAAQQNLLALELELELDRVALGDKLANAAALAERLLTLGPSASAPRTPLAESALARAARLGVGAPIGANESTPLLGAAWFEALRAAAPSEPDGYTRLWTTLEPR